MDRLTQEQLDEQLFETVKANDIEAITKAINDGANLNARDEYERTPLGWASKYKYENLEVVALLKQHGDVA